MVALRFFSSVGMQISKKRIFVQFAYLIAISLSELLFAFSLMGFAEVILGEESRALGKVCALHPVGCGLSASDSILLFGLSASICGALSAVLNLGAISNSTILSLRIRNTIQTRVVKRLDSEMSASLYPSLRADQLWDPLVNGVGYFLEFLLFNLISSFSRVVAAFGIVILAFLFAPVMMVSLAAFGALYWLLLSKVIYRRISVLGRANYHNQRTVRDLLSEHIRSFKEMRAGKFHDAHREKIEKVGEASIEALRKQALYSWVPRTSLDIVLSCAIFAASIAFFMQGRSSSTAAGMSLVLAVVFKALPPLQSFASNVIVACGRLTPVHQIISFLAATEESSVPSAGDHVPDPLRGVVFSKVTYAADEKSQPIIRDLDLELPRCGMIAVLGKSGSGKSTFLDLLAGARRPVEGRVVVAGLDLWGGALPWWRDRVLVVPAIPSLFSASVRENVNMDFSGSGKSPNPGVDAAIAGAQLTGATSKHWTLDSVLDPQKPLLSNGEMQRIGIARALLHSPAVIVMDEITGGLDPNTEHKVLEALAALKERSLIVVATHRLQSVGFFDRLIVFNGGVVVGDGAPSELQNALAELESA